MVDEPMVVVVGETGSGKSALGMELARRFDGEIICADSRTIYRGMDIGTAKPSRADQQLVRHHLLDLVEPGDRFTVAEFKRLCERAISDVQSRGKLPIMVGGSGLYVDSILYDYQFVSPVDVTEREALNSLSTENLQQLILERGLMMPENSANKRYLVRTLEIGQNRPSKSPQKGNTLVLGLAIDRQELSRRIKERTKMMFEAGLEAEVAVLARRFGWDNEAMKSVGYREFNPSLQDQDVQTSITTNTLKLAKKQRTWFKRNTSVQWLTDPIQAVDLVTTFLNKKQ
jgi:tRNA dimethylallyltransferase